MSQAPDRFLADLASLPGRLATLRFRLGVAVGELSPARGASNVVDTAELSGFLARPVELNGSKLEQQLRSAGSLVVRVKDDGYLIVLRTGPVYVRVIGEAGRCGRVRVRDLAGMIRKCAGSVVSTMKPDTLEQFDPSVREILQAETTRNTVFEGCWLLEPKQQAAGLRRSVFGLRGALELLSIMACHIVQFGMLIVSWTLLGAMLLQGRADPSSIDLWLVAIGTLLAARFGTNWMMAVFARRAGLDIRSWVLESFLGYSARTARRQGLGRMLAASIDASRIDRLAVNGVLRIALSAVELATLFSLAAYLGMYNVSILLSMFLSWLGWRSFLFYRRQREWRHSALNVTAIHTEEMIGHRTRKSLLGIANWYEEEDAALLKYAEHSRAADERRRQVANTPRIWLLAGTLVTVLSAYLADAADSVVFASMLGIVLLAFVSLQNVVTATMQLVDAVIAFDNLDRDFRREQSEAAIGAAAQHSGRVVGLSVAGLTFSHPDSVRRILDSVDFEIAAGERCLLEGESGSGKSTLAKLVSGRLDADEGSVLLGGLDGASIGSGNWRRRVCYVPQPNANHVFTGTFAFNLLMGKEWPPQPESMAAAREVAEALGLGPVLARMPAGMMQVVGDGGWSLSQGERARLYVARALLQRPDLLIVDEPLDALDPAHGIQLLAALKRHPGMLLLISHS